MTARHIQYFISAVFFILGGWALLMPQSVIDTVFLPELRGGELLPFMTACFGSQAIISGIFAAFARFTPTTFLVYGFVLLPFFVFNWWFTFVEPVFNMFGLIDAAGNLVMLGLCFMGWKKAKAEALHAI